LRSNTKENIFQWL